MAQAINGMAIDYGKMPHEILAMPASGVAFAIAVRMRAGERDGDQ